MLIAIAILLLCQLAGETISRALNLPRYKRHCQLAVTSYVVQPLTMVDKGQIAAGGATGFLQFAALTEKLRSAIAHSRANRFLAIQPRSIPYYPQEKAIPS